MIPVVKPFLPPLEEYQQLVQGIWQRNWLTNNGPLVVELEEKLREKLRLENLLFVTNGTIAIQMAIKALDLKGKIITTPFSYVATTSSIVWENCEPVFVDIDPNTCNIDPRKIEEAIVPGVTGILATHVYGNPCDVEAIQDVAQRHNLKVIYDGAHAFNVTFKGKSIFEYGDISTCSFHATKLFHTIEGGSVVARDPQILKKLGYLRNFGHDGFDKFAQLGVNGKNSEFHAAMGLVNLRYVDRIIQKRKALCAHYDTFLPSFNGTKPVLHPNTDYNYSYYPVIFESLERLLKTFKLLQENDIFARRYFYPSLDALPYVSVNSLCKNSASIAERVLCLPLYDTLTKEEINKVFDVILQAQKS
jgi:dTDP-4-amino-4,6-dideoxygalactose transaminase